MAPPQAIARCGRRCSTACWRPAARRPELVETLARWNRKTPLVLLEDAAYRELRYDGADLPSLAHYDESGELVASTGTFSKSFAPGVRIGWGVLPKWLVEPVLN